MEQRDALEKFREKLIQGIYSFEEVSCLCGNRDGKLIARRDRYALPVNTFLCQSCGVMWQSPRMAADDLVKFYSDDYRPIYVGHAQASENFFMVQVEHGKIIYDFVASDIRFAQELTVFDVGCGAGGVLIPFIEGGWRAFGCDVAGEYLQCGRSAGLVIEYGDVGVLAKYGKANLVILSHVLEHLPFPRKSLEQLSSMLVNDGWLYIELPGILSIHKSYKNNFLLFLQNAHLYHFTLTTLARLMAETGFKLVKGDKYIHALFQKRGNVPPVLTDGQFRTIMAYLYFNRDETHSYRYATVG